MSLLVYLVACLAAFCYTVAEAKAAAHASLRNGAHAKTAKWTPSPPLEEHKLRLCNAVVSNEPLEMSRMQEPKLVEYPLPFKECHDYTLSLRTGDELLFRAAGKDIGTFVVQSLPSWGSLLVLVPHMKPAPAQSELAFASHVFEESTLAQVALIDATSGTPSPIGSVQGKSGREQSSLMLTETRQQQGVWIEGNKTQELNFGAVVSLTSGLYRLALGPASSSMQYLIAHNLPAGISQQEYQAKAASFGASSYVALRVGGTPAFPEELVVFPHVSLTQLAAAAHSKSARCMMGNTVLLAIVLVFVSGPLNLSKLF